MADYNECLHMALLELLADPQCPINECDEDIITSICADLKISSLRDSNEFKDEFALRFEAYLQQENIIEDIIKQATQPAQIPIHLFNPMVSPQAVKKAFKEEKQKKSQKAKKLKEKNSKQSLNKKDIKNLPIERKSSQNTPKPIDRDIFFPNDPFYDKAIVIISDSESDIPKPSVPPKQSLKQKPQTPEPIPVKNIKQSVQPQQTVNKQKSKPKPDIRIDTKVIHQMEQQQAQPTKHKQDNNHQNQEKIAKKVKVTDTQLGQPITPVIIPQFQQPLPQLVQGAPNKKETKQDKELQKQIEIARKEMIDDFRCSQCKYISKLAYDMLELNSVARLCYKCCLYNMNPFSDMSNELGMVEYQIKNQTSNKCTYHFHLNEEHMNLSIEIRCVLLQKGGLSEITFPQSCQILVNNILLKETKPLQEKSCLKKRKDNSIVMNVREFYQKYNKVGNNYTFTVNDVASESKMRQEIQNSIYYFGIYLVKPLTPNQLVQKLLRQDNTNLPKLHDIHSEIKIEKLKVSLSCQYDFGMIVNPVRGILLTQTMFWIKQLLRDDEQGRTQEMDMSNLQNGVFQLSD